MSYQNVFKRYELKFLISKEQQLKLKSKLDKYMCPDKFGSSTINNIYFDTEDKILVRRSNESPIYKEKLRLRSYDTATADSKVFIELKKKYEGVVYKRRIAMSQSEAMNYLCNNKPANKSTQITKEIDYFLKFYKGIKPYLYISYERQGYFGNRDRNFRMTFDENIMYRDNDLSLERGPYGENLLDNGTVLLEVKTSLGMPLWLIEFFSENNIYKSSFSKYGNAYKKIMLPKLLGGSYVA